jgi:hypothetical protein
MPKTSTNSKPCACCGRLMPRKTGKRLTCGRTCERNAKTAATWLRRRARGESHNS